MVQTVQVSVSFSVLIIVGVDDYSREDPRFLTRHGLRKAFISGSSSTYRAHIRSTKGHAEVYEERCTKDNVEMHWLAVPEKEKPDNQQKLDAIFKRKDTNAKAPQEFSKRALLEAITKFIVCDDQVSSVA